VLVTITASLYTSHRHNSGCDILRDQYHASKLD